MIAVAISLAGTACHREGTASKAVPSVATVADEEPLVTPRTLALASSRGNTAVDGEIDRLRRAAEAHPAKSDFWILLGQAWVRKARESSDPGYYLNANACADVVLELSPGAPEAENLRAMVLLNQHRFRAARDLAESILVRDRDNTTAWGTLSDAWLELGDLDQASRAARRMMILKPNLPSYVRASYLQWIRGDNVGALESVRLAVDAAGDPRDQEPRAWAIVQAAMVFWHQGDYAGADAGFEQALAVAKGYAPALVGRGRVAMAEGEPKRAAEFYERALEASPSAETAWLLSEARALHGDPRSAEALGQAEAIGRRSEPRTLSLVYSTLRVNPEEALRLAEEETKVRGDIYTDEALAWALYRSGRHAEARTAIDRALRHGTRDARLLFRQGAIHMTSGDEPGGRRRVEEALALNPHFDVSGAAEARELIARR